MIKNFKKIKCFVFDIDGVMTNGKLSLSGNGEQERVMDIKDGYILQLAIKEGYKILVISGAHSEAVIQRLQYLGISEIHTKVKDKLALIQQLLQKYKIEKEETLFMGDDMPDMPLLKYAGISSCPHDAIPQVRAISMYISRFSGGQGCVRDVIEKVLQLQGKFKISKEITAS